MKNSLDPDQLAVQILHCFQNANLYMTKQAKGLYFYDGKVCQVCLFSVYFCIGSNKEELLNIIIFIC